ncbi:MAG: hypothetical protein JRF63_10155, partial [Deltaproteobacteria bacterium]|nr:hypothetical protein [Deltaproteobacteria bacterium]
GKLPFFGKDPGALLRQHVRCKPRRMSAVNPHLAVSREVEKMVMRCLSKSRHKRPQSMTEIIDVLTVHGLGRNGLLN